MVTLTIRPFAPDRADGETVEVRPTLLEARHRAHTEFSDWAGGLEDEALTLPRELAADLRRHARALRACAGRALLAEFGELVVYDGRSGPAESILLQAA